MKKLLTTVLAVSLSFALFAQKIGNGKVPAVVKEALKKVHPSATAKWEWEDKAYEANFKEDGREMSCIITKDGTITETETEMKLSELPKATQDYVAKNYRGKKIAETAKIVAADGTVTYEAVTGGKELIFAANGNFKEQKREEKKKTKPYS